MHACQWWSSPSYSPQRTETCWSPASPSRSWSERKWGYTAEAFRPQPGVTAYKTSPLPHSLCGILTRTKPEWHTQQQLSGVNVLHGVKRGSLTTTSGTSATIIDLHSVFRCGSWRYSQASGGKVPAATCVPSDLWGCSEPWPAVCVRGRVQEKLCPGQHWLGSCAFPVGFARDSAGGGGVKVGVDGDNIGRGFLLFSKLSSIPYEAFKFVLPMRFGAEYLIFHALFDALVSPSQLWVLWVQVALLANGHTTFDRRHCHLRAHAQTNTQF